MSAPGGRGVPDKTERDDLVAQALGSLPVPQQRPDFWQRLDSAMDAIDTQQRTEMQDTQLTQVAASGTARPVPVRPEALGPPPG